MTADEGRCQQEFNRFINQHDAPPASRSGNFESYQQGWLDCLRVHGVEKLKKECSELRRHLNGR